MTLALIKQSIKQEHYQRYYPRLERYCPNLLCQKIWYGEKGKEIYCPWCGTKGKGEDIK